MKQRCHRSQVSAGVAGVFNLRMKLVRYRSEWSKRPAPSDLLRAGFRTKFHGATEILVRQRRLTFPTSLDNKRV
jgi:hypothetical protein